ncbi:uncharacterized protein LOC111387431 isoform X2 [Olea europaea var. sylvestris]|uniref:uncharacterized protein LOC111387431 isoform X2 n=1 Tax=Olea europaea var. sylvestris TaxID=158386 RepID=UPI000C1D5CE8|nr:uncharacterized protein LOC111387431 isoform X2 [Olea europaea var. sylvestris]
MAEYLALLSPVKLHSRGNILDGRSFVPKTFHVSSPSKRYVKNCKVYQFSAQHACKLIASHLRIPNVMPQQKTFMRCRCMSALVNAAVPVTSDWIPVMDQVFLLVSITLTYMAGVIPAEKFPYSTQTRISEDNEVPENSSFSGRSMRYYSFNCSATANDKEVYLEFAWDIVKGKIMDSLCFIQNEVNVGDRVAELEEGHMKKPSSLCAVTEGPRMRLLWASFQWLKDEVVNISGNYNTMHSNDFLAVVNEIFRKCCQPLCIAWMEEELCLVTGKPDMALLSSVVNKLNGRDIILRNIRKSGKEDLYAELIFALRFGSVSPNAYYNRTLFTQHGVAILEDLVITLADGIASMYLELISVDSSLSNEMNSLGLSLCRLSTRALQRLRNEVALHQWLHQNMEAVVSMYEDHFDLRTLHIQPIEKSSRTADENANWWKQLCLRRSGSVSSSLRFAVISHISLPVKRTMELRDLTGWRYYFSLFLELTDITMPIIRTVIAKVSDAISFFLVCLIGRSLGLIYSGIRQSLRWK